jgi:hypothetical protein
MTTGRYVQLDEDFPVGNRVASYAFGETREQTPGKACAAQQTTTEELMENWYLAVGAGIVGLVVGFVLGWCARRGRMPAQEAKPAGPSPEAVRLLALLQREGRLVDFLLEPIEAYSDSQIGAAVREIHRKCAEVLNKTVTLEKILPQEEGQEVEVPTGFDPSAIRLVGAVSGQPPFRGTVRHPGWRVREVRLPSQPLGQDPWVLMPAEVEVA